MYKIRNSEWKVLKSNLINSGLSYFEANKIIEEKKKIMLEHYDDLKFKLEKGKIEEQDMNQLFKDKFWRMVQKLER